MLIQLAVMGMIAALLPLTMVWMAADSGKYRKLASVALFLTFDLIMFGAFTRLTDSGLGCPDWPGCYGHSNPLLAHAAISAAQEAMPTGPVTLGKAWIEMIHRYLAMGVGVLITALLLSGWYRWHKTRKSAARFSPIFPTVLFLCVCLQGAFGAWTVTLKLQPVIVTTHLLLGLALLGLLTWLVAQQSAHRQVTAAGRALAVPALIAGIVLVMQIALGGWVSTNYATLACMDFPLCQGALLPQMDFENGFTLWRHLGKTANGDYLPFPALTAIHWVHRTFAFVVIAVIVWVARAALREPGLRRTGQGLLFVIALQLTTGLATIFLSWPLAIAVLHNGGAAALLLLLVMLNYKARYAPLAVGIAPTVFTEDGLSASASVRSRPEST
ncbi:COX15/CtaA family protein [Herbaspirillum sp. RTI4]|uniref:COX15/CtaA family protein n=1 Tax=Herbaspirillum sp. RTI4 TaxID=3048640 RepID=UPI002AB5718A|nr:COX15/CtaA family protein [Herbaspirillum sp. RTI4]MDY7577704.1 COX15/CtaA family protein [Herbaspirillum sp. RTI4]MEA9980868.1 COX15/CtaA family protein [Herbaspirillum sp. RTI4]